MKLNISFLQYTFISNRKSQRGWLERLNLPFAHDHFTTKLIICKTKTCSCLIPKLDWPSLHWPFVRMQARVLYSANHSLLPQVNIYSQTLHKIASYSSKTQILNDQKYNLSSEIILSLQISICHNGSCKDYLRSPRLR